jgi:hypothetical protein
MTMTYGSADDLVRNDEQREVHIIVHEGLTTYRGRIPYSVLPEVESASVDPLDVARCLFDQITRHADRHRRFPV